MARAVQADVDCALDVLGDAKVRREQISRAGRDDRKARPGAGELVDAALHHPVAAPGENEIGALVKDAANARGRLAALGHLVPKRVADTRRVENAPQLRQSAVKFLAGVSDYGDLHERLAATAPETRQANTTITSTETPIVTPASVSIG